MIGKPAMPALAALQFFGCSAAAQIESERISRETAPVFFEDKSDSDIGCDFFFGVACVFKTYQNELVDNRSSDMPEEFGDFVHRLNHWMYRASAAEWSEDAVLSGSIWARLRIDANKALAGLGESLPNSAPQFDIARLVNPEEFI